ncbi:MAG: hypothetical protein U9N86_00965 [Bacteroidota bacterium]|nr:hypothetical protein [Bacteroidota bacterium]
MSGLTLPDLDDTTGDIPIPKLLIQIPVENAIKHGLLPKNTPGTLKVSVAHSNGSCEISITDDGIGRKEAGNRNLKGTGRGLKIMDSLISYANEEGNDYFSYSIEDLPGAEATDTGTIVKILIKRQ